MAQKKKLFNRMSCVHQLSAESPAPLTYSQRRAPQQHRDRGRTLGISSLCQLPPREIGGQPFKPQYCSGWVVEPSWMPLLLGVRSKLPFNESFGSIMQNIQKLVVSNGFQPISKKNILQVCKVKIPTKICVKPPSLSSVKFRFRSDHWQQPQFLWHFFPPGIWGSE